jgi:hypothetical protein
MHDAVAVPDAVSHAHDHAHVQGGSQAHSHDGSHPHSHHAQHSPDAQHAHAPEQAPENVDNLILDIGADTGALIIHATADRDQAEIEISPAGSEQARTHNIVRRREAVSGAVYAAVFPALTAGDYVVWRDAATAAGTVAVHGGRVASFRLN